MTNLPLSELEAALKKATPGEWQLCAHLQKAEDKCCGGPRGFIYAPNIKAQGLPEGDGHICLIDHDTPRLHDDCFLEGMPLPSRDRALANAALIVLLRNNADALVEAAKKAEELEVAHELSGQRYANAIELWGEKKALAEESARKLAEAEREVEMLRALFAGAEEQHAELQAKFFALQAENAKLREALQRIANREEPVPGLAPTMYGHAVRIAQEALSSPPKSAGTKEDEHVG